jgi:hypothetical protein
MSQYSLQARSQRAGLGQEIGDFIVQNLETSGIIKEKAADRQEITGFFPNKLPSEIG